jgi:glucokinase
VEDQAASGRSWLLIDCAHQGEVRLARVVPSGAPILGSVTRYEGNIPTFTDVLLRYQQEHGVRLLDLEPIIAIAGPTSHQSMRIERSRWVISRDGLSSLFGRSPIILNEVAAQAWALKASLEGVTPIHGHAMPDLSRAGRYVFMTYEEGVGTAIVDIDDQGHFTVLDGEGGQIDFTPVDDAERGLLRSLAGAASPMSWEQALMARQKATDAASAQSQRLYSQLLGRFVSNLIYASGAWSGAFLCGALIPRSDIRADFERGLTDHRPYTRLLTQAGCWRVSQSQTVLKGCAARLASSFAR